MPESTEPEQHTDCDETDIAAPRRWMPAVLLACGTAAYSSSFVGTFLFDDIPHIALNESLRSLWPIWGPIGESLRVVAFYSFAINYAISGTDTWSYHLVNLLVHLAAGLTLFGIVRRTLRLPVAARFRDEADRLAVAAALLWLVHPLTTQAVTYVVQRSTSMSALFYLLSLYCFVRAQQGRRGPRWYAGTFACLLLAVGSKETAATAPLLLLLYDRSFLAGTFRGALRRRWALYGTFVAAPIVFLSVRWLAGLPNRFMFLLAWGGITNQRVVSVPGGYEFAPLPDGAVTSSQYLMTQAEVVLHYLRLTLWPDALVFDYDWRPADGAMEVWPALLLMGGLLLLSLLLLARRPPLGFVLVSFFVTLAVTSSLIPLPDAAVEHRMYLPLVPLVVLAVLGASTTWSWTRARWQLPDRVAPAAVAIIVAMLASLTFARNLDYQTRAQIWADVIAKRPENARAHYNLGTILAHEGALASAQALFEEAIRRQPDYASPHANLATLHLRQGRREEALEHYRAALRNDPFEASVLANLGTMAAANGDRDNSIELYEQAIQNIYSYSESEYLRKPLLLSIYVNLGAAHLEEGRPAEARQAFELAVAADSASAVAHAGLGRALLAQGELDAAAERLRTAIRLDPTFAAAHHGMGELLLGRGSTDGAIEAFRRAVRGAPTHSRYHDDLGVALAAAGDAEGAYASYTAAIERDPSTARPYNHLGMLLATQGKPHEAIVAFQRAAAVDPGFAEAHDNIGTTLADLGRYDDAVMAYLRALFVDPTFARAHNNLAVALWKTGARTEAASHLREALRIRPDYAQAAANLERLLRFEAGEEMK